MPDTPIETVFPAEHGRVLAALISRLGDFELAEGFCPNHAARAGMLRRTGQREAAAEAWASAVALCGNSAERAHLQRRLNELLNRLAC